MLPSHTEESFSVEDILRQQRDAQKRVKQRNTSPKLYSTYRSKRPSEQLPEGVTQKPKLMSSWTQHRVDQICRKFIRKLKHGVVLKTVYNVDSDNNKSDVCSNIFGQIQGFDPHNIWIIVLDMLCLVMRLFLGVLFSIDIVFQLGTNQIYFISQSIGVVFVFIEIMVTFVTKIDKEGRRINYVKDIAKHYLKGALIPDTIYFSLILTDLLSPASKIFSYIRLIATVYKLIYSLQRIDKLQKISFSNHQSQQIWGIFLVIGFNFIFAHILSLVLNMLAQLSPQQNWWHLKNCHDSEWYVKYIYGAYFGTNIMLTVGFGDMAATNWIQATGLIFIEMISCIVLSYNISCLGGLITNLRKNNQDKNNNVRLFNRMYQEQTSHRDKKPYDIKDKVYQFLDGHFQTKKQYNLQDQKQVLSIFPESLKQSYFHKVYIPVIKYLPIMRKLSTACLSKLANSIEKVFVYPQSFIAETGDKNKIIILSKGEASFVFTRINKQTSENSIIQNVSAKYSASLISGKEVVYDQPLKYNILSRKFSIIHMIDGDKLRAITRQFTRDHQSICKMRDSQSFTDFILSCLLCKVCNQMSHSKYNCPILHYSPLKSIVITKSQSFTYKQNSVFVIRIKPPKWNLLRKAQLTELPKVQKTTPTLHVMTRRQSKPRRPSVFYDNIQQLNIEYDRVHNWSVYFPQNNMQFRNDQDIDFDFD